MSWLSLLFRAGLRCYERPDCPDLTGCQGCACVASEGRQCCGTCSCLRPQLAVSQPAIRRSAHLALVSVVPALRPMGPAYFPLLPSAHQPARKRLSEVTAKDSAARMRAAAATEGVCVPFYVLVALNGRKGKEPLKITHFGARDAKPRCAIIFLISL